LIPLAKYHDLQDEKTVKKQPNLTENQRKYILKDMNTNLLTYLILKKQIANIQKELGYEATALILARILEETYEDISNPCSANTRAMDRSRS
jgi:hypothetical protein